jgi:hypothetical protein
MQRRDRLGSFLRTIVFIAIVALIWFVIPREGWAQPVLSAGACEPTRGGG